MPERRVVITGTGAVSAAGIGSSAFQDAVRHSRSCISPLTLFDTTGYPIRIGGQVPDFHPEEHLSRKIIPRTSRNTHFALIAASEALAGAGLDMTQEDPSRVGCVMGTMMGGGEYSERGLKKLYLKGPTHVSPFLCTTLQYNGPMAQLAIAHNLQGCTQTVANEMASGLDALRIGTQLIRDGEVDAALVGGCEAPFWPGFICIFASLALHASHDDCPEVAYRPFDLHGTGLVLGEGAALLVLEAEEHALARGALPLAEVIGYGASFDGGKPLTVDPKGTWYAAAMRQAMRMARVDPVDIDVVIAEGRGSPAADQAEANAIRHAFEETTVPVTSVKPTIGHALSAAGPFDALAAVLMMRNGVIPPLVNLQRPLSELDIDWVRHEPRRADVRTALLGARSLGGVNIAVVLRRVDV